MHSIGGMQSEQGETVAPVESCPAEGSCCTRINQGRDRATLHATGWTKPQHREELNPANVGHLAVREAARCSDGPSPSCGRSSNGRLHHHPRWAAGHALRQHHAPGLVKQPRASRGHRAGPSRPRPVCSACPPDLAEKNVSAGGHQCGPFRLATGEADHLLVPAGLQVDEPPTRTDDRQPSPHRRHM
jgi:hypothetical protein